MGSASSSRSASIRARLGHPVIDSDGHSLEVQPEFLDCIKEVAGPDIVKRYVDDAEEGGARPTLLGWYKMSPKQRADLKMPRFYWGQLPAKKTIDLATSMLPKLLNERLDEMGIDFSVLYAGVSTPNIVDDEVRQAVCFALNKFRAEVFRPYAARMTPTAEIPMNTPQEAIAELEHAVKDLGMKAVMFGGFVRRPIPAFADKFPRVFWYDSLGIDSEYDYSPLWAKAVELKVAVTFHQSAYGEGLRVSPSNFVYNYLGSFQEGLETVCKSAVMSGLPRRFPQQKFAFMEGGVAWAIQLYSQLISVWGKRNVKAVENYNLAHLDRRQFADLMRNYGSFGEETIARTLKALTGSSSELEGKAFPGMGYETGAIDDFAGLGIERAEEFKDMFTSRFFFGCEGDDMATAWAFDTKRNPFGAKFNIVYGSDISHWDVPDQSKALEEVWELVEKGMLTEGNVRDFVFANPVKLWTTLNPDFFKGTVVEDQVRKELSDSGAGSAASSQPTG